MLERKDSFVGRVAGAVVDKSSGLSQPVGQRLESDMSSPSEVDERQMGAQSGSCCCKIRWRTQTRARLVAVRRETPVARDCSRNEGYSREKVS